MIHIQDTPCASCPQFRPTTYGSMGVCLHKEGPTGKVFGKSWFNQEMGYPKGCPIDPSPPTPPRRRPSKKRQARLLRNPELPLRVGVCSKEDTY